MSDNYGDYPQSITEIKANKSDQGAEIWTPRDALISALRQIDNGELAPTSMIIVCATIDPKNDSNTKMNYFNVVPNTFYGAGMLQAAISDWL